MFSSHEKKDFYLSNDETFAYSFSLATVKFEALKRMMSNVCNENKKIKEMLKSWKIDLIRLNGIFHLELVLTLERNKAD